MPSLEAIRRMSQSEKGKMSKQELLHALDAALGEESQKFAMISEKLNAIHGELSSMHAKFEDLSAKQKSLAQENEFLRNAVLQQQKFLESIDAEKRASNVIILGVPEDAMEIDGTTHESDDEKVAVVFSKIEHVGIQPVSIVRLGKNAPSNPKKGRPMKIVLSNQSTRSQILEKAKKLKESGDAFEKIYIKKDVHPQVRKEFRRLRDVEKNEKERPENVGKNVRYVHETRCVMVEDQVVDRFQPLFF